MSDLGWLLVNCRYVTTVSKVFSSAVISRFHTNLVYTNSRLQFGLRNADWSQLQDSQHLVSSNWPTHYHCHTFVSCLYLYEHNTLQGRYLPNSKWAPCNADEQALTEDAQRLKVNNVAGILRRFLAPLPFVCKNKCTAQLPSTAGLELSAEPQTRHICHCIVVSKSVRLERD